MREKLQGAIHVRGVIHT